MDQNVEDSRCMVIVMAGLARTLYSETWTKKPEEQAYAYIALITCKKILNVQK